MISLPKKPHSPRLPLLKRLMNAQRWSEVLKDQLIWMMVGCLLFFMLAKTIPGYPVIVGTPSIPMGVYWLDRTDFNFKVGDYVTFDFNPADKELLKRYAPHGVWHTKMIKATEGYTLTMNAKLQITVCSHTIWGPAVCEDAGIVRTKDSQGRTLSPWLKSDVPYKLKRNELWVYGPHPMSLDSRYHGPVFTDEMKGTAHPLWLF